MAGLIPFLLIMAGIAGVIYGIEVLKRKHAKRRAALITKYGSEFVAEQIMQRKIWQGMTSEMLTDSWGRPLDVDTFVYKTKPRKEVWKYGYNGRGRFHRRVTIEGGNVVGWEIK